MNPPRLDQCQPSRHKGFVLLMVLVVIMVTSMVAASLLFVLSAEHTASAAGNSTEQIRAAAMSGIAQAMRVASDAAPGSTDWQDNPALFRDQLVMDDGSTKWFFSIYSRSDSQTDPIRYGLTDEAGKINVYHAEQPMLEALPNMTPPLAQNLLAAAASSSQGSQGKLDIQSPTVLMISESPSDTSTPGSASAESASEPPIGGWSCVDEIINVSGFNPRLLYGSYSNYTGRIDTRVEAATDDQMPNGLCEYLTVASYDWNKDNDGHSRINLNDPKADLSGLQLPKAALDYIETLHREGQQITNVADLLEASGKFKNEQGKEVDMRSEIGKDELPVLLDRCTTTNASRLTGLVNINTASAKVLAALPGLNDSLAESIISARAGLSPEARQTPAWLYQEGILNADAFKKVVPHLTTRGRQFHFFVAAYSVPAASYQALEVVIDAAVQPATVISIRDVSRLGLPFAPAADPMQAFRKAERVLASSRSQPGDYL